MKNLIIGVLFLSFSTYGQTDYPVERSSDQELIDVLNTAELLSESSENYLSVRVYKVPNEPGSAGTESGEVTHDLYIAVSGFDEAPKQSLFKIGPFYNPKFVEWKEIKQDQRVFILKFGPFNEPKMLKLTADIEELQVDE